MWTSIAPVGGIGGGQDGPAAMKNGVVKFFNEAKGFGFIPVVDKLCPGHPSCPPQGYAYSEAGGLRRRPN